MIKVLIGLLDKVAPGYKTYGLMFIGFLMMICQMFSFHHFSNEVWGLLGIGGATTWKMGMDRK